MNFMQWSRCGVMVTEYLSPSNVASVNLNPGPGITCGLNLLLLLSLMVVVVGFPWVL